MYCIIYEPTAYKRLLKGHCLIFKHKLYILILLLSNHNNYMHNILIFGDSISVGKGVEKEKSWPILLCNYFDKQNKYSILVHNLSFPGESTNEVVKRFSSETKTRDREGVSLSIIFTIGINDARCVNKKTNTTTPENIFRKNIETLIKEAQKYTNNIVFIGISGVDEKKTMPLGNLYFSNKTISKYSAIVNKICDKNNVSFINLEKDFRKKFIAEDGVHLNRLGHQMIADKVVSYFKASSKKKEEISSYEILQKTYQLSEDDISALKKNLIAKKLIDYDFFFGQINNKTPEIIIGAPCIRNSTENICLNLFSQIFTPIKIARIINKPCKIFIGLKEEIIFQPKNISSYYLLGDKLEETIRKIAKKLNVEVEIINSNHHCYDKVITKAVNDLKINISNTESTYLFELSKKKRKKETHSQLRVFSSERIIACYTSSLLNKLFGKHNNLIVADIEQMQCLLFSKKYDKNQNPPNILPFLPLPNIYGTGKMFNSKKEEKILLKKDADYYNSIFNKSPSFVLEAYYKLFELVVEDKNLRRDAKTFENIMKKINDYIK